MKQILATAFPEFQSSITLTENYIPLEEERVICWATDVVTEIQKMLIENPDVDEVVFLGSEAFANKFIKDLQNVVSITVRYEKSE